jgi:hypothetical protein
MIRKIIVICIAALIGAFIVDPIVKDVIGD